MTDQPMDIIGIMLGGIAIGLLLCVVDALDNIARLLAVLAGVPR